MPSSSNLESKERIKQIKSRHRIEDIISNMSGAHFTRSGKNLVTRCPFPDHKDTNPSFYVNPAKQGYHCFGCGRKGDVIAFIQEFKGWDFRRAIEFLDPGAGLGQREQGDSAPSEEEIEAAFEEPRTYELLEAVVDYCCKKLEENHRAQDYLHKRGLWEPEVVRDLRIGYDDGSVVQIISDSDARILRTIGYLNSKGNSRFYRCIVIPFTNREGNRIEGIYGRRIGRGNPQHLYLRGAHRGMLNAAALAGSSRLILAEAPLDAASFYCLGFKESTCTFGASGIPDYLIEWIRESVVSTVFMGQDRDSAGEEGAKRVFERLGKPEIECRRIIYPEGIKDANDLLVSSVQDGSFDGAQSVFDRLLDQAPVIAPVSGAIDPKEISVPVVPLPEGSQVFPSEKGVIVVMPERTYSIELVDVARPGRLRVLLRAQKDQNVYPETLDLYASGARGRLITELSKRFSEKKENIEAEVLSLLGPIEEAMRRKQGEGEKEESKTLAPSEWACGKEFGEDPNLIDRILDDMEELGVVGEETNKLVGYLALTSRKMDRTLSILMLSSSGSGKSMLQNELLSLVPPEDLVKHTTLTSHALYYKEEDMSHKCLAIEESAGAEQASYPIRVLLSEGHISIEYTTKDPVTGNLGTKANEVKGPVSAFLSSTSRELDEETISRFLVLWINESGEQTLKILSSQGQNQTLEGLLAWKKREAIIARHHAFQRALRPVHVVNPLAPYLVYPDQRLSARREHPKYQSIINAVAFLRQFQKEWKSIDCDGKRLEYIEVDIEDVKLAHHLALETMGRDLDELTASGKELLEIVHQMVKEVGKDQFTMRELREFSAWNHGRLYYTMKRLTELEYFRILGGRNGTQMLYRLDYSPTPEKRFIPGLLSMQDLEEKLGLVDNQKVEVI